MTKSKCLWFRRHHWDKPDGRYQSCKICGVTEPIECAHKWEIIKEKKFTYRFNPSWGGVAYTSHCAECGEMKVENIDG